MNRVEFKTIVHNGIIEIPKDSPEIKDKEVNVIIQWEEKPVEDKAVKKSLKFNWEGGLKELKPEFNGVSLQHYISKIR
jgi:hypothetical protein